MKILFPCNPLEGSKVDSDFMEEHRAAKLLGFDCYLFDHDKFVRGSLSTDIPSQTEGDVFLVLRSWMLNMSEYTDLYNLLKGMGYSLVNSPEQYKNCHHFPESYDYTKDHTSKAIFIKEWDADILQDISEFFGDKDFLMKDFVK